MNFDAGFRDRIQKIEFLLNEEKVKKYVKDTNEELAFFAERCEENAVNNKKDEDYDTLGKLCRLAIESNSDATYASVRLHMLTDKEYMKNIIEALSIALETRIPEDYAMHLAIQFNDACVEGIADTKTSLKKPLGYGWKTIAFLLFLTIGCWGNSGFWYTLAAIIFGILSAGAIYEKVLYRSKYNKKLGFVDTESIYKLYKTGKIDLGSFNWINNL